jgi:hypothetical protein
MEMFLKVNGICDSRAISGVAGAYRGIEASFELKIQTPHPDPGVQGGTGVAALV